MNLTVILRRLGRMALAAAALSSVALLSSCGSTIYGMGVDMERIGGRMQGTGRPTYQQAPSQGYQQQTQAPNQSWGYYQ